MRSVRSARSEEKEFVKSSPLLRCHWFAVRTRRMGSVAESHMKTDKCFEWRSGLPQVARFEQ